MTFVDYLSVVRRRWLYLVVGLLAGALSGYLTAPGRSEDQTRFEATHTLIVDSAAPSGPTTNLDQAALLASTGPVPDRVLARLHAEGLGAPEAVVATPDTTLLSLSITAVASEAKAATAAADLTAEEVVAEFVATDVRAHDAEIAEANEDVDAAEEQRAELFAGLAALPEGDPERSTVAEEIAGLSAQIPTLRAKARNLAEQGPPEPPLRTLEAAEASRVDEEGWSLPADPLDHALLLAAIGLGLGLVGAFVAEQVDSRIRGAEDAEDAFDLAVVAEVPRLKGRDKRRSRLVTQHESASPFVEAYRSLRTVVVFASEHQRTVDGSNGAPSPCSRVILVTSPSAGDGKTTTAAHLAVVLAEVDKRVLVIDADRLCPRMHEHFGIPHEPGLSDLLEADDGHVALGGVRIGTPVHGVHLVSPGKPDDNPAQLLNKSRHVIAAARRAFDYVVVDTPPLLVANDAAELAAETDMVVLVGKVGGTRRAAASRSTEILRRIEAPVLGVVLQASPATLSGDGYSRSHNTSAERRRGSS